MLRDIGSMIWGLNEGPCVCSSAAVVRLQVRTLDSRFKVLKGLTRGVYRHYRALSSQEMGFLLHCSPPSRIINTMELTDIEKLLKNKEKII